jgi:outer membrane protein
MMTFAIFLMFLLSGGPASAAPQDPQSASPAATQPGVPVAVGAETLTLEDALARATANSQRLAELQAREQGAEAAQAGRAAAALPIVALMGGYTRTNHVEEFGITVPGLPPRIIYPDVPDNLRARLDLQWPIYTGGRTGALERAARAEHDAAGEDLAAARAELRLEVTRAFWALVTARETEQVVARSLQSMQAHVADLRTRLDQGLIPPNDVLSAEAQASRARLVAIEAGNARAVAVADLRRLLGSEGDGPIEPLATLAAATGSDMSAGSLIEAARHQRPERRALEDRVEASEARSVAVTAAARPQLAIGGGYDYARPNPRIFPRVDEWRDSFDLTANITWQLWDGGRRRAEYAEATAATRGARSRVAEFDRQVAFEVRRSWLDVDSSRAAVAAAEDGLRSATEARRVVSERFNAGVAINTDVLDAELAVLQAGLDRTRALANARLADARLQRAIGQ